MFRFTRESEHVIDKPHVSLKVGTGCPAGCDCDFSIKKLKKNTLFDSRKLLKNIEKIDETFSKDFEIFLVGLNLLKHADLKEFIHTIVNKGRSFKLQITHDLDGQDMEVLLFLYKTYGSFHCSIPKTIDSKEDCLHLISILKSLGKIKGLGKVYFDIFLNIDRYKKFIDYTIQNFATQKSNNYLNCIIGDRFDIKFHDLSWKLDHTNKIVDNLKRHTCLMKDYFSIENNDIFLCDHIEVGISGDMTFHDNLCYLGNFTVSNIYKGSHDIMNDFFRYKDYIFKISQGNLKHQCYTCIDNRYDYKRSLDTFNF